MQGGEPGFRGAKSSVRTAQAAIGGESCTAAKGAGNGHDGEGRCVGRIAGEAAAWRRDWTTVAADTGEWRARSSRGSGRSGEHCARHACAAAVGRIYCIRTTVADEHAGDISAAAAATAGRGGGVGRTGYLACMLFVMVCRRRRDMWRTRPATLTLRISRSSLTSSSPVSVPLLLPASLSPRLLSKYPPFPFVPPS